MADQFLWLSPILPCSKNKAIFEKKALLKKLVKDPWVHENLRLGDFVILGHTASCHLAFLQSFEVVSAGMRTIPLQERKFKEPHRSAVWWKLRALLVPA